MNNKPFLAKFSKQATSAAHPSHLFQEFEHNSLLHDHGVEQQDEEKQYLRVRKNQIPLVEDLLARLLKRVTKK